MVVRLEYGRKYRANVAIAPIAKVLITDEMIANELRNWQLYGLVTPTDWGYQLDAEFRGQSGDYDLPAEVESVEILA